ncbi:MAG: hypothetical protein H7X86_09155, partial [Gorillibacterium sp.]|nr:hypothetical protein [Gorillibacterium sp.]
TKQIEEALDLVAVNMEEENRELIRSIAQIKHEFERRNENSEKRILVLEKRIDDQSAELRNVLMLDLQKEIERSLNSMGSVLQQHRTNTDAILGSEDTEYLEVNPQGLKLRYHELFLLYQQGKSIEQIAKKLGINKGETALIIQLAKQEEEGRA